MGVSLSKNSWHYRLHKYTFGQDYNTDNLCPYFWSTLFVCAMAPLTFVGSLTSSFWESDLTEGWEGRYYDGTRRTNNISDGFKSLKVSGFVLFLLFAVYLVAVNILDPALWIALGFVSGFGFLIFLLIGVGLTGDIWVPYLNSLKDKVCPRISWKEDSVQSDTKTPEV